MTVWLVSLSIVVLNSKDHQENVRLPKYMRLEKQSFKIHNAKTTTLKPTTTLLVQH